MYVEVDSRVVVVCGSTGVLGSVSECASTVCIWGVCILVLARMWHCVLEGWGDPVRDIGGQVRYAYRLSFAM